MSESLSTSKAARSPGAQQRAYLLVERGELGLQAAGSFPSADIVAALARRVDRHRDALALQQRRAEARARLFEGPIREQERYLPSTYVLEAGVSDMRRDFDRARHRSCAAAVLASVAALALRRRRSSRTRDAVASRRPSRRTSLPRLAHHATAANTSAAGMITPRADTGLQCLVSCHQTLRRKMPGVLPPPATSSLPPIR